MIDECSQLVSFKVDCNFLTCLPPRIGYIKSLKVLSANKNRLHDMPESLILSQVEELYLNHNLIERLPLNIGQMQFLKLLHIQSNPIISLPRSFNCLKATVKFDWLDYISSLEDIKYLCGQTKNGMVNFL
jgi:Leucine-rich repeat (LRR) protein